MSEGPSTRSRDLPERGFSFWEWVRSLRGSAEPDHDGEMADPIDPHARMLLDNVMRLRSLSAADIMVPRVDIVAVEIETPFNEVVRLLVEEGHSRLPVYRDDLDHIVGMVHVKDVLGFVAARRVTTLTKLLRKVLVVAPSTRLLDLLTQMRLQRVHMAFVIDEFGGTDGLITIEDVVEEIVGDIEDEHDEAEPQHVLERPDGSLIADARTPIEELEAQLHLRLLDTDSEEAVDTLGGLIVMLAGRVPARGEVITHPAGPTFTILDGDPRRIRRVRIGRAPTDAAAAGLDDGG